MEGSDASVTRSTTVVASPEAVWAALAAFDRISTWAPDVDHSTYVTDQHEGIGAVRRVQVGRTVLLERIVEWEPPAALAYDLEGLPPVVAGARNRWTLRADGERTEVTLTSTVDPGAQRIGRVAAPLVLRRLAKASEGMLAGLATHLERAA
jgi:uncharacterized protein YndB with AHSA1/START domain